MRAFALFAAVGALIMCSVPAAQAAAPPPRGKAEAPPQVLFPNGEIIARWIYGYRRSPIPDAASRRQGHEPARPVQG